MGFASTDMGSPVQEHPVQIANGVMWVYGQLETLGNPHHYINQEGQSSLLIKSPHIAPWTFTGLPASRADEVSVTKQHMQFLIMPGEDAMEQFRAPPRMEPLIFNLPLAVIRGNAPFLSEAKFHDFLDYWKGLYLPILEAEIHYLTDGPAELPTASAIVYVNRESIQNYIPG